jgi:hypothetical protein
MGQQETVTVAGSALRRMFLVLAVAVLMAAMLLVLALPAFAGEPRKGCEQGFRPIVGVGGFVSGCSPTGHHS